MAEFVEFRCEEWTSELEHMLKINLFEPKEIKSIATKRREFEYKIERQSKKKEDYLRFIQFEINLHKIINMRREKMGIKSKKLEIESKQITCIIRLFKQVIYRFSYDIKLWMSLFQFCTAVKYNSVVSKMLVRLLQSHSNDISLWIYAAKWELEHNHSFVNARQFLIKGLRHHPSSDNLYSELFKIELKNMRKKQKLKEIKMKKNEWIPDDAAENIVNGKVVKVIYKSGTSAIKDADFKVNLLNIAKDFEATTDIQNMILNDLLDNHLTDEITWESVVRAVNEGNDCDFMKLIGGEPMESDETGDLRKRIEKSIHIYKMAVSKLNTAKMWNFYLDYVKEIYSDLTKLPVFKYKLLKNAMEDALESGHIDESSLLNWIEILRTSDKCNKVIDKIFLKGLEQYPKSLPLWHARLKFHLSKDDREKGKEIFEIALANVDDRAPLWELMTCYYEIKNVPGIEDFFKKGVRQEEIVASLLKPKYLQWLVKNKGLEEARRVFDLSDIQHPPSLELYRTMIKLEAEHSPHNQTFIRKYYELACNYLGGNDIDIWMDYVKWEINRGDVTKVSDIHRKALKSLNPEKADAFLTKYNFVKADHFQNN